MRPLGRFASYALIATFLGLAGCPAGPDHRDDRSGNRGDEGQRRDVAPRDVAPRDEVRRDVAPRDEGRRDVGDQRRNPGDEHPH